jgi:enoyl-CoA hydratase/carnithine racemase
VARPDRRGLTGEAIDARKASEWGLVEQIGGDDAVDQVLKVLLRNDARALRMQKELLQLWEEAPLAASIEKSIALFGESKNRGQGPISGTRS